MTIAPLVPAERDQRIEAQRAVAAAEAEELAARQRLQRLEQLLKDGAASVRSVEEARAQHQVTVAALDRRARAAGRRVRRTRSARRASSSSRRRSTASFSAISAVPGQTVAASAPLLEIAQVDTLWVRVPCTRATPTRSMQTQPAVGHEAWRDGRAQARDAA